MGCVYSSARLIREGRRERGKKVFESVVLRVDGWVGVSEWRKGVRTKD